jgi:colanic acid/amylovoran biosynthesis protein
MAAQLTTNDVRTDDPRCVVGILGASFETGNFGIAALTCGAVASICHSSPSARIFFVDYAKQPTTYRITHRDGDAIVQLVNVRFSKRFYLPNNIARLVATAVCLRLLPFRWRRHFLKRNHVLNAIYEADIIGSIAGGDSFSDIYGFVRLLYVALPQFLVLLMGKSLVLLPQTIGPFKGLFSKAIGTYILRHAQMVYSRDYDGLKTVSELVGCDHRKIEFCYDMGFVLESRIVERRVPRWLAALDRGNSLVGINVSGLLDVQGYGRKNMFGLKADYLRLIHQLIERLVCKHHAHLMLVPHVFADGENSESDVTVCRRIYSEVDRGLRDHVHLIEEGYNQHELKALIGRCDFFVGSRMHACIAALSQCVPAAGLAYSRKFLGVFKSVGMENFVVDLTAHDHNTIIEVLDQAYQRRAGLRVQLETKMPAVHASVLNLFARLL